MPAGWLVSHQIAVAVQSMAVDERHACAGQAWQGAEVRRQLDAVVASRHSTRLQHKSTQELRGSKGLQGTTAWGEHSRLENEEASRELLPVLLDAAPRLTQVTQAPAACLHACCLRMCALSAARIA